MRQPRTSGPDVEFVQESIARVLRPVRPLRIGALTRTGGYADACYVIAVPVRYGSRSLVMRGSLSRSDRSRWYAAKAQAHAWRHGFHRGVVRVPKPIGYDSRSGWWWYTDARGASIASLGDRARTTVVPHVATALAKIHRLPTLTTLHRPPSEIQRTWNEYRRVFRALSPRVRTGVVTISRSIERLDQQYGHTPSHRLVHHDLHPQNMLWTGRSLIVLDFTESRLSHPLVDVATSVIQWGLQGRAHKWHHVRTQQLELWRHYQRLAPVPISLTELPNIQQYVWRRIALQRLVGAILERRPTSSIISDLRHPCPDLL